MKNKKPENTATKTQFKAMNFVWLYSKHPKLTNDTAVTNSGRRFTYEYFSF